MALEDLTGTNKYIANLVATNPLSADDRREGDDHIRGVKNVLLNTFGALAGPANYVNKAGDVMTGGLTVEGAIAGRSNIELGDDVFHTPFIDFHTTGRTPDFDVRIIAAGPTAPSRLNLESATGAPELHIAGSGGITFENVAAGGTNLVAFAWRSDSRLGLRVDNAQMGDTWPININGTVKGGVPDFTTAWGFAANDSTKPYMRVQGDGSVRYLLYQTSNDDSIRALRAVGAPIYMEVQGAMGAFGVAMTPSDERLKGNIAKSKVDASAALRKFVFKSFTMQGAAVALGFSAQNLQGIDAGMVIPVKQPDDSPMHALGDVLNLNSTAILAYLGKALQESIARIDQLQERVESLELLCAGLGDA